MAALGRILQVVGWFWVLAGFFGSIAGYEGINIFPGLILVFVARAIRNQAAKRTRDEPEEVATEPQEQPQRVLNTERVARPQPAPEPVVRYQKSEEQMAAGSEEPASPESDGLIERIVLAGREEAGEDMEHEAGPWQDPAGDDRSPVRMSSAEMLARAHERWNRKR